MSWPAVALGEVADINPRGPGRGELAPSAEVDFVPMASVSEGGEMTVSERRTYDEVSKGFTAFKPSDVLLAKITPCFENNKIAKSKVSTKYAFGSTEFHVLRGKPEALDPDYLTYFLRQDHIREAGERRMTGSGGQRRVPKTFLEELKIPLPPLEEQKRIAGILDQAVELCRLRTRALDKLNTLDQAIFHEMFGEDAPTGAQAGTLGDFVDFFSGNSLPEGEPFEGQEDGHLLLKVSDLNNEANRSEVVVSALWQEEAGTRASTCAPGALIFPKRGGAIGTNKKRVLSRPAVLDPNLMGVAPKPEIMTTAFLEGWFARFNLSDIASGSSVPQLNKKDLAPLPVVLPSYDHQIEYGKRCQRLSLLKEDTAHALKRSSTLFASLQHRAFRGEL